jgi:hypothetical protein
MFTVIHKDTYEVLYQGPHSNVASRKMMQAGAMPAGWVKVKGNTADARAVLANDAERVEQMKAAWSK